MLETKCFELRDTATFIPIVAIRMSSDDEREQWLLRSAGYGHPCVLMMRIDGGRCHYDPHEWNGRTYPVAHEWIAAHWDELTTGDLIDVRFILEEAGAPCESEKNI